MSLKNVCFINLIRLVCSAVIIQIMNAVIPFFLVGLFEEMNKICESDMCYFLLFAVKISMNDNKVENLLLGPHMGF